MNSKHFLSPSDAANRLKVSAKALRHYEKCGLLNPVRTASGWRTYGPDQMARATEIVALRTLGFSLAQIARVLDGNSQGLDEALAAHQTRLEVQLRELSITIQKVHGLRIEVASGQAPASGKLRDLVKHSEKPVTSFHLPWPWGGERFEVRDIRPLNYITGPLASGKTRLAKRLAERVPNACILSEDRLNQESETLQAQLDADPALRSRVVETLAWLVEDGATQSHALKVLICGLETEGADILVVDMVEKGLDEATQLSLMAYLRRRGSNGRPLFLLTRSSAILDLESAAPDEAIILCPANHSPPIYVFPNPGTPGYEAVDSCLAPPEVRARTEGIIAVRETAA